MLNFPYACPRHKQSFIEAANRGGYHDPAKMDQVRRKALAWLSAKYPRAVLDHYNEKTCLVCKLEAYRVDLKVIERVIIELAKGRAPSEVQWIPTLC